MIVRLTQLDGKLPNLALMHLASFHRSRGDVVRFTRSPYRHLDEPAYDRVYGSAIFDFSAERVFRLRTEFPGAIVGGTWWDESPDVGDFVEGHSGLDYSFYPDFQASIGF